MKENLYNTSAIRVHSGKYVDIDNITPDDITIEDITHSLSMQCRFGGHTRAFYSVAQHSLWVAKHLPPELKLTGLLHDASEAYLLDIPKPVKNKLVNYDKLEDKVMSAIADKFGIKYPLPKEVKEADRLALGYEWENLVLSNSIVEINREIVEQQFIDCFYTYKK